MWWLCLVFLIVGVVIGLLLPKLDDLLNRMSYSCSGCGKVKPSHKGGLPKGWEKHYEGEGKTTWRCKDCLRA